MRLARFVTILTGAALIAVLLSGAAVYVVAWQAARADRLDFARLTAEAAARSVHGVIELANQSLAGLARDPLLAATLAAGDPSRRREAEDRMTRLVPGALQVRLLPENAETLDESRAPHMGFADLQMVRQALTAPPPPALHGANTPDVHLALARRLDGGGGVILASLSTKLLEPFLASASMAGALELRQAQLSVSYVGDASLREVPPAGEAEVPGAAWKIVYRTADEPFLKHAWFLVIPLLGGALFSACAFLLQRWLIRAFRADQESVAQLVKDLLGGKALGNYPIRITDGELIVQRLAKLQREARGAVQAPAPAGPARREEKPLPSLQQLAERTITGTRPKLAPSIFRAYDIRGVVGETLTAEIVFELGLAIGSEAHAKGEQRVIIARDGRLSSADFSQALARGLQATGRTVIDLGLVPTPLLYFATHVLTGRSGVMVTGSHNPANYNGLKIVIAGETLAEDGIQNLRARIEKQDYVHGAGKIETRDIVSDYIERVVEDTQLGRSLKIVMDCGNGVAGRVAPTLMKTLGCDVVELYCDVDGNFPHHHPDPSKAENLAALIETVVREQADLGVAFDGDGDRLGVVDSSGRIIWPDRQMMVFAADVLSRQPGADIIYDVKCTRQLASQIVKHGGRPLMWKTGHSLIKAKMKETGAMLAGEMSGHIVFSERWYGFDDGIYACARLAEILTGDPRSTAEVFADLPDSVNTPELHADLAEGENFTIMERLKAVAAFPDARVTDIDGLRVDFIDGWGLVRPSNTTPSLVFRFEADSEVALARIQGLFRGLLLQAKPDIRLPF